MAGKIKYIQLRDVELSFFGWDIVLTVCGAGGQYVFRGTDTQPVRSPSLDRANSNMNFPSVNIEIKAKC